MAPGARARPSTACRALVQATQRSLSEPRAVRPPIEPLEHLQAHSYQLLAQLSAVKSMLVLRRDRLTPRRDRAARCARTARAHRGRASAAHCRPAGRRADAPATAPVAGGPIRLPDPFDSDISPWLLRRLDLAERHRGPQLRDDAARILPNPSHSEPSPTDR